VGDTAPLLSLPAAPDRGDPGLGALLAAEEVAYTTVEPARQGRRAPFPRDLHPRLRSALRAQGIEGLYAHQLAAWQAARSGRHVIITTGTASGKSLAFNLPILDTLLRQPHARALYLYPTKALAQDQARALAALGLPELRPAIYDGDTPAAHRRLARRRANALLSNPDMLHVGILPHHDRWADVLHNLRYVVVDEAHVYRGVFGSHVANVLRRLRRLARLHGARPQFLLASATIANPGELARALAGLEAVVVDEDAAPRAERVIVLWNPALVDEELGLRASPLSDAARLLAELVEGGLRSLCFAKSRRAAELIHRLALERLGRSYEGKLSPYRAGYTPEQRRDIERRLVAGELLAVTATDALELGIDVGLLDCVLSVGFPGTVASLRQQWGRAGRRGRGLAVLVAGEDALDQYFMREPESLLGRRVEAAMLDPDNPRVLDGHLLCAAFEAPLGTEDGETLGEAAMARAAQLPELRRTRAGFVWAGRDYPAARLPLRSTSAQAVLVVEEGTGTILGTVELERAFSTVHEGAIYLHLGEPYLVRSLDLEGRAALVAPFSGDWYTQAKRETGLLVEEVAAEREILGVRLLFGRVTVTEQVVAYQRRAVGSGAILDLVPLEAPPTTFDTEAVWFLPGSALLEPLKDLPSLLAALHAAEHALIALLPLWAMCDRWDIGGLSTSHHLQTGCPSVFIYDGHPGGVGIAERGYQAFAGWVADAARLLAGCPCSAGCPSCVQSPKCGNLNDMLDKGGALRLLDGMLAAGGKERG
jgi:DEAD/DEAH box helicase domain-containing protein